MNDNILFEQIKNTIHKKIKYVLPISIIKNNEYNYIRLKELVLIGNIFYNYIQNINISNNVDFKKINNIIIQIELSCFNKSLKFSDKQNIISSWTNPLYEKLYRIIISKITKNLDITSEVNSKFLIEQILKGNINVSNIANIDIKDISPENNSNIYKKIEERMLQKVKYKESTLYRCKNCGKRKCSIKEIMTRALDEGTNVSCTCLFCYSTWVAG